jgi:glycosyltransferase involved in cell wall biosynthesis
VRIALVSTPFVRVPPPGYGGTELVVHVLARALERMAHEVTVFATGDSRAGRLRWLFERPVWPPDPYAELLHCRAAAREIARSRFDVVHAHAPAMLAFADELDAPLVYTLHHAGRDLERYYAAVRSRVWHVAISARQAELASIPVHAVVHHGLEPAMYPACGPGGDVAFFLGRLSWVKGPELAVEAARRAGLPLVVAGEEHGVDEAPPRWHEEVLAPALRAPGVSRIPRADLAAKRRLLARSRALLVPLRWEEPFGLVMIEALLAGCPVIASPRGAAPEIVEHGRDGFLVKTPAEMAEALRHAARLDRPSIQARARQRFSADRMAAEYVSVYLAAGARGRAPATAEEDGWTTLAT